MNCSHLATTALHNCISLPLPPVLHPSLDVACESPPCTPMEPQPPSSSSESLTSRSTESMEIDALSVLGNSPPRSVIFLAPRPRQGDYASCCAKRRLSTSVHASLPLRRESFSKELASQSVVPKFAPFHFCFSEVSRHPFQILRLASERRVGLSDLYCALPPTPCILHLGWVAIS